MKMNEPLKAMIRKTEFLSVGEAGSLQLYSAPACNLRGRIFDASSRFSAEDIDLCVRSTPLLDGRVVVGKTMIT